MNIRKRLEHLAEVGMKDRQLGRTTALAEAAKKIGAIVLTADHKQAVWMERHFPGIVAKSMELNLEGFHGPFLFDHYAIERLLIKAANKISTLEADNANLEKKLNEIYEIVKKV